MGRKRPARVREPIQVYLAREDRALLDSVAKVSGLSRAEVLRRGIRAVSADLMGDEHPAIKLMREMHAFEWDVSDVPRDQDAYHAWVENELEKAILDDHQPGK